MAEWLKARNAVLPSELLSCCVSPPGPSARLGDLTGVRHHSGSQAISISKRAGGMPIYQKEVESEEVVKNEELLSSFLTIL